MNTTLLKLYLKMQDLLRKEEGQDVTEYALILALVVTGSLAGLTLLGTKVTAAITAVNAAL